MFYRLRNQDIQFMVDQPETHMGCQACEAIVNGKRGKYIVMNSEFVMEHRPNNIEPIDLNEITYPLVESFEFIRLLNRSEL